MNLRKLVFTVAWLLMVTVVAAQEPGGLQEMIRQMNKEADPYERIRIKNRIISDFKIDSLQDAETMDMLNGNIALAFALQKNYPAFEQYIQLIRNPFNQTSMLSMAANELLDKNIDPAHACELSRLVLEKYFVFKDDPAARPAAFSKEDWERFMNFAKYPYYDSYARSLMAVGNYEEALSYQLKAFDGKPEDALPASVERYARLLALNGDSKAAKELLLKIAGKGKLNAAMTKQLQELYAAERGTPEHFDRYMDSLQAGIQAAMRNELKQEMLDEAAPPFTLKDLEGRTVSLSGFKGKIVILDLWATWCVPCIASFPAMQKQVDKHSDVIFLFIVVDEKAPGVQERVKKFISKHQYTFRVLLDEPLAGVPGQFKITSAYKPDGIPAKYFIDRSGRLRFTSKGFDTDDELVHEMDAMIALLKEL